ncbi:precorrin-4 C(11)-methyltransferase [Saccharopolyspora erythraea]|uniref:precorrin-4 C(11)-methyltransferase n=1 Tax=Saccharopolyspora erythraea TaxID=1836 RepID=UPI001BA84C1E|nr:precorrin-4 C(11)-methyltransferase [Saccharopolyspora erythraea]QUH04445.1 precorrin-4 C(11)-methyltransferase [Saccharopolyspora erythraea]
MIGETHPGRVSFVGAGPGAADLITVRGARRIAEADVVVWTASLVAPECIQEHARTDAELVDSSRLTHEEAVEIYRRAERDRLKVARVHSGDPALWGAVQDQYDACARMDLEVEIVPGVATFSAAAAAAGRELTVPEVAQSVVLTRLEGGQPPMPERERVREFARHGTTMAVLLSAARAGQLADELLAGGYTDDVPVLIAYKVSWPDEVLLRTTVGELAKTVKQHRLWRNALFMVGRSLEDHGRRRNYPSGHFHAYRRPDATTRRFTRGEHGARAAEVPETPVNGNGSAGGNGTRREQPGSDVAWWAVRSWQETARGAGRPGSGRSSANKSESVAAQPHLFLDEDEPVGERAAAPEVPRQAQPSASEASEAASGEGAKPRAGADEPVAARADAAAGESAAGEAKPAARQEESATASQPWSASAAESTGTAEPVTAAEPTGAAEPVAAAEPAGNAAAAPKRASAARRTGTEQATASVRSKSGKTAASKTSGTRAAKSAKSAKSAKTTKPAGGKTASGRSGSDSGKRSTA